MTPPETRAAGQSPIAAAGSPAVSVCLKVLRNRADFLRAARGLRKPMPGFLLQARKRVPDEAPDHVIRVGYTCSRKVGNAVARNRAKRRLREIARVCLTVSGHPGWDYVLVGRPMATANQPFADLLTDLKTALAIIHQKQK
ncbi:ribonuclease P protein component [Pseudohalocynthiibacter sp. F2068]|jgi:ribonuclease P protein component|uniref:ribonuclease P protein component n=1 Tax=Pseudohalocynthiibacter sp. F2068 TaxID=2926418 RepID=UPI001FF49BE8|nr:ribonuclease P protein component [Pseudohalocynthiibacter sp. F2068]MCK0101163.1 ribonuclease P protein component [Pseudohalocynthiibacter sp. F2068]